MLKFLGKKNKVFACVLAVCMIFSSVPAMADVSIQYGDVMPALSQDATVNKNFDIKFSFSGGMLRGVNTSQTVTLWTTNIPDGSMVSLSMNDNNGLWIPPSVKIMNNTATFTMYSLRTQSDPSYTITATYQGVNFNSNVAYSAKGIIDVSGNSNEYITNVEVKGRIGYGYYNDSNSSDWGYDGYYDDYVTAVVTTQNVPDGTSLNPTVTGGLTVRDSAVQNDKAVIRIYATRYVQEGTYKLTLDFNGNKTYTDIIVGNGYGYSNNEQALTTILNINYFDRITQGNMLYANGYSMSWLTIDTKDIPNGTVLRPVVEGGLMLGSSSYTVTNNQVLALVINQGLVPAGDYRFKVSHGGSTAEAYIVVSDGSLNSEHFESYYNLDTRINSDYFVSANQANVIQPIANASSNVTVITKDIAEGEKIYPTLAGSLTLDKTSYTVSNNTFKMIVANPLGIAPGSYKLRFAYNGDVQEVYVVVGYGQQYYSTSSNNAVSQANSVVTTSYITSISANSYTLYDGDSATVTIITNNIPDGTALYPECSSRLDSVSKVTVNNNRATFKVYNDDNAPYGTYPVRIAYGGETAQISFLVPNQSSSSRSSSSDSLNYNNSGQSYYMDVVPGQELVAGTSGETSVLVRSSAPNGTRLDVTVPTGLSASSATLNNGEAVIKVMNDTGLPSGVYKGSVSYRNMSANQYATFNVIVQDSKDVHFSVAGLNPYITDISVTPDVLNKGVARDVSVVITTKDVPNGTLLYPMVSGSGFTWNPSKGCIVTNNRAVFTLTQKSSTPAGSYVVSIPYTRFLTEVTLKVQ